MQRFAMRLELRAPMKRGWISLVALIAAVALLGSAACQQIWAQANAPAARTLVRAGHLLDVHTGKMLDAQTIVVTGDRITAIAATSATPTQPGDKVIIITYADYERAELESYVPRVVHVDGRNRVIDEVSAHLDAELTLNEPA